MRADSTITGTLDVTYGGNFTTTAGIPTGGTFTSLKVDLNGQTLMNITDFSLPYGAGAPDFSNMSVFLATDDVLTGSQVNEIISAFAGADAVDETGQSGSGGALRARSSAPQCALAERLEPIAVA